MCIQNLSENKDLIKVVSWEMEKIFMMSLIYSVRVDEHVFSLSNIHLLKLKETQQGVNEGLVKKNDIGIFAQFKCFDQLIYG